MESTDMAPAMGGADHANRVPGHYRNLKPFVISNSRFSRHRVSFKPSMILTVVEPECG